MINTIFVIAVSCVAITAALFVAFSPSKSLLATFSVMLTVCFSLLSFAALNLKTLFWIAPAYLILDVVLLYFIFATSLQSKHTRLVRTKDKIYLVFVIYIVLLSVSTGLWEIWSTEPNAAILTQEASPYLSLWGPNWQIVLLCFLLLAPTAVGALLMVRTKN